MAVSARSLFGAIWALTMLAACSGPGPSQPLTVFGAASLTDALGDLRAEWEATKGDRSLIVSTGSSAALRAQIEQGAPADVFLSADMTNPQALVAAGLADGQVLPFASNRLVVVVPRGSPAGIDSAADLAREGVCIIAAGENVPITRYASELVTQLAARPDFPAGFAPAYDANVCSREDDVRAVVAKIELGEGDAAIVYASDAADADVTTIDLPPGVDVRATYGGVVLERTTNLDAARELLSWIAGRTGQQVLADHGFTPAD